MNKTHSSQTNTQAPHAFVGEPHEVVGDPALSKEEKKEALDVLEQDARQLSVASAEGMTGGEPTGLHEVLAAKDSLELPPTVYAYDVVLNDLRSRLKTEVSGDARAAVERALAALDDVVTRSRG